MTWRTNINSHPSASRINKMIMVLTDSKTSSTIRLTIIANTTIIEGITKQATTTIEISIPKQGSLTRELSIKGTKIGNKKLKSNSTISKIRVSVGRIKMKDNSGKEEKIIQEISIGNKIPINTMNFKTKTTKIIRIEDRAVIGSPRTMVKTSTMMYIKATKISSIIKRMNTLKISTSIREIRTEMIICITNNSIILNMTIRTTTRTKRISLVNRDK